MTNNEATEAAAGKADEWLIVSRGLYFRPACQGYTGIRDNAGRYSLEFAKGYEGSGTSIIHISEAREFMPAAYDDLVIAHLTKQRAEAATEIASLRERVKELEEECFKLAADTCHAGYGDEYGHHRCREVDAAEARADTAEQQLTAARKALDQQTQMASEQFCRAETAERELDASNANHRAMAKQLADLGRERDEARGEPTDAQIDAAAEVMWNDRDARHGGPWSGRDKREIVVIQTRATARAALRAARGED